jgi:hypothetical protein
MVTLMNEVLSYDQVQFLTPVFHGDYQIELVIDKNSGDLCEVFGYEIQHGSLALSCAIDVIIVIHIIITVKKFNQ